MNDATTQKRPLGSRWCSTGYILAILGVVLAAAGVLAAQVGLLGGVNSFLVFGIGLLALLIAGVTLLIGLLLSKGSGGAVPAGRAWGALIVAGVAFAAIASQRPGYESGPAIHDLTTDLDNPPAFDAIAPLRADAQNPVEYAGPETAKLQRGAFPDLTTVTLGVSPEAALAAADEVARELGWEVVAVNATAGTVEATDVTRWFRFKDDVVIRIAATDGGSVVDVRSKSRVGRGDMGTNAHRIRTFLTRLQDVIAAG